jgi:hypothetical protein
MLDLDSPHWAELQHAYGSAADIPNLLRHLNTLPASEGNEEPWHSLWSALAVILGFRAVGPDDSSKPKLLRGAAKIGH